MLFRARELEQLYSLLDVYFSEQASGREAACAAQAIMLVSEKIALRTKCTICQCSERKKRNKTAQGCDT